MITYNQISNAASDVERMNKLSKTAGGREVLKNIAKAELLRLWDRTQIYNNSAELDLFKMQFKDIVRPNKFELEFGLEQKVSGKPQKSLINFHATYLTKSFTIPAIKMNKMEFKRAGKNIKIPLNMNMDDSPIEITFYHDVNNTVLRNLFTLLNINEMQYHNQFIETSSYISLQYKLNMNYSAGSSYTTIKKIADFAGIDLLNTYEDSGDKSTIEKVLTKNFNDKIFEFKFKNIFISDISGFDWDMEKIDTFADIRCSIDFNGFEFKIWDTDLLLSRTNASVEDSDATNIINDKNAEKDLL